jgi:mRNA interferase MazF
MRRPVLIVQDDLLTDSKLATIMVVPLTSNLRRAEAIGNPLLKRKDTGLSCDSVALVCQVLTVDKEYLTEMVSSVSRRSVERVDLGLKLSLDLR